MTQSLVEEQKEDIVAEKEFSIVIENVKFNLTMQQVSQNIVKMKLANPLEPFK